jgi:serine-type D-Ala-D-Ala carboxypeptidase/endopeptidase (penicillin-binding protein 4)
MTRFFVLALLIVATSACSRKINLGLEKSIPDAETKFQDHVGFALFDVSDKRIVFQHNADKYFTPASNTKIFTLYTSLRIIGDSIPALNYIETKDSLIVWGTGDPSFLYKFAYQNNRVYDFLKLTKKTLAISTANFYAPHFGPGWAWDDYNFSFSSERSPFPVYGNIFTVERKGSLVKVTPALFDQLLSIGERKKKEDLVRDVHSNQFKYHPGVKQGRANGWDVPMKLDQQLVARLLSDTLRRPAFSITKSKPALAKPFFSIPADSLYKVMMQESDNFIAEQLLLICSDIVRDSLSTEVAIKYSTENFLRDLPDKPVWVDGSGLSRYNLFTPRTLVKLWEKIYEIVPKERLFSLLATGGKTGTIKNWYKSEQPYVFAKTGTVSNNHSLSGFLVTKKGKVLIFAFMNNNYVASTSDIRRDMEKILFNIYEKY